MTTIHSQCLQSAQDDRRFFSNVGSDEREWWVLKHWCAQTSRCPSTYTKRQGPDFSSSSESVEVTEVVHPGRRRGDENRAAEQALQQGNLPAPTDAGDVQTVITDAHEWIADAISKKASHYGKCAADWILLIYANYSFCARTQWAAASSHASASTTFKEIHVLTADGEHVQILKP